MKNNIVLITGATQGIGLATSKLLNNNGYQVIGIARNNLQNFPGELYTCDLSDRIATDKVLDKIKERYPQILYIINNVGVVARQPLEEVDLDTLSKVFDLNVRTAVQITQAFIEEMKALQYGRIINLTSRALIGIKHLSSYVAAKSALLGLTRTWAVEFAPYQITVNSVAPGPTETELFRKSHPVGSDAEKDVLATIPLGRIGQPQEIAATIKFLLSEDAGFITGQNICVDGGGSL